MEERDRKRNEQRKKERKKDESDRQAGKRAGRQTGRLGDRQAGRQAGIVQVPQLALTGNCLCLNNVFQVDLLLLYGYWPIMRRKRV